MPSNSLLLLRVAPPPLLALPPPLALLLATPLGAQLPLWALLSPMLVPLLLLYPLLLVPLLYLLQQRAEARRRVARALGFHLSRASLSSFRRART